MGRLEYMDETKAIAVKKLFWRKRQRPPGCGRESARSGTTLGVVEIQGRIMPDHANT